MSDSEITPRSSRNKRKSGLAKLAAKKREVDPIDPNMNSLLTSTDDPLHRLPPVINGGRKVRRSSLETSPPPGFKRTPLKSDLSESGLNFKLGNLTVWGDERDPDEDTLRHSPLKRTHDTVSSSEDSEVDKPQKKMPLSYSKKGIFSIHDTFSSESLTDEMQEAYSRVLDRGKTGIDDREEISSSPSMTRRLLRLENRASSVNMLNQTTESLSGHSSASTSCLTAIPAREAREKLLPPRQMNFLVGSMAGAGGSMLGAAELEKLFPERSIRVLVATWNMSSPKSNEYPMSLHDLLLPDVVEYVPDIYVISFQEAPSEKRELLLRLQATVGPNHVLFEYAAQGTLCLCVFLRRDLIWYTSVPEQAYISTRAAMKTKGAIAINFTLFGSSILVLNAHFKSDDGNFLQRVEDYQKIISSLNLPKLVISNEHQKKDKDLTHRFDVIFWSGDLNFRINRSRAIVDRVIRAVGEGEEPNYEDLLQGDELLTAQAEGTIFQEFEEGRINFPPTYKYDLHTNQYDTSDKNRIPSYTDRILYRSRRKGGIACLHYDSVQSMVTSDHRPVFGLYEVEIKPGLDNIPLSAGAFHRDIYVEGNRRRALHLDISALKTTEKTSKVCVLQ